MHQLQQTILFAPHALRAAGGGVVETVKVQNTVDKQPIDGHLQRNPVFFGLLDGFIDRHDDIAEIIELPGGD